MKLSWFLLIAITGGIVPCSCTRIPEEFTDTRAAEYRLVRLHYQNSVGENGLTHFHYNRDEQNYMAVWHLVDSSMSSLNYHTLDSAGRVLVKSREFSDGISSIQHFNYDAKGNLVHEDFTRSDGITGEADYVYSEDGELLYADCRGLDGWFYGKILYTWEDGKKTGADLMKDSVKTGSIVYDYNDGRLVMEKWDFPGNRNQAFRYEYQQAAPRSFTSPDVFIRESNWFRVASENYDYNGETSGSTRYTYDEYGKMTSGEFVRSDGQTTMSTYEYDSAGLPDLSRREYGDGRTTDYLYWYSADRKLLVKTYLYSDGTSGSETYRYEEGKLTRGEYVNVDGWLNGILSFEYDENDIIKTAVFAGKDGFDASVDFSYDLDLNLERIHWKLSSGQTQTYYFNYEPIVL